MSDFNFENEKVKQGGGHTTIPTKNILKIKNKNIETAMEKTFDPKAGYTRSVK